MGNRDKGTNGVVVRIQKRAGIRGEAKSLKVREVREIEVDGVTRARYSTIGVSTIRVTR